MAKKSDTQRAIESLEGQIANIQAALDALRAVQTTKTAKPAKVMRVRRITAPAQVSERET